VSESNLSVYDCVVIGGGLSGLVTARNLYRSGKSILLIEARGRIGGRMHGLRLASGQWIDLGGKWAEPTQDRILALLDEYRCATSLPQLMVRRCFCSTAIATSSEGYFRASTIRNRSGIGGLMAMTD
jgi:monoamine oxidase